MPADIFLPYLHINCPSVINNLQIAFVCFPLFTINSVGVDTNGSFRRRMRGVAERASFGSILPCVIRKHICE